MTMPEPAVSIRHFSKTFGQMTVVQDLSFDVQTGETFAFLGANGSGKTTTIRCLLNIMQSTSGELLIDGQPYSIALSERIGYLPEERGLYLDANVLETMVYFGTLKGLTKATATARSQEFLERVGLGDKRQAKIKTLSSGQQQKIQLGLTIVNQPSLLVLDEPTKGLDPVNRSLLLGTLSEMKAQGTTIIFITHQMDEVEKIADRLVMIKNGRRELYGDLVSVKQQFGDNRIHLEFSGTLRPHEELYTIEQAEHHTAELKMRPGIRPEQIFHTLAADGLGVTRFEVALPSLQDIFVTVQSR